jgi:hypothetical protein
MSTWADKPGFESPPARNRLPWRTQPPLWYSLSGALTLIDPLSTSSGVRMAFLPQHQAVYPPKSFLSFS